MPTLVQEHDWEHAQRSRKVLSTCCSDAVSGVYMIRNSVNGKIYIGSSALCVFHRMQEHARCLRLGKHTNAHLQAAWNKYGEDKFDFEVLCQCPSSCCIDVEQEYLDETQSYNPLYGYNLSPTAASSLGCKMSDKAIANMRASKQNLSPATIERMRSAAINRHTHSPMSEETRAKLSIAGKGRVQSVETRAKRSRTLTGKPKKLTVPRIERTCPECGVSFIVKAYGKGSEKRICSEVCRVQWMRHNNPEKYRQDRNNSC